MRRFPHEFLLRLAYNALRARLPGGADKTKIRPLMASLYLTTKCNFRCIYCDDGCGNLYPHLPEANRLETEETIQLLEVLRREIPAVGITGGEPTLRRDLVTVLEHVSRLGFAPVALNTNGHVLDRRLEVLPHLDYLVVSLDATDETRGDLLIDAGSGGQTRRITNNLDIVRAQRREHGLKFQIVLNTVILPETIDDAWDVLEYCRIHGDIWSPMPHIVGKYPHPGLVDNPRWQELVRETLRLKRRGTRILGNRRSLELLRDFSRFECYPTTRPVIYPNGEVFYPCAPLHSTAVNLLEAGTYARVLDHGRKKYGRIPQCDSRCHLGCYTEPSSAVTHPTAAIADILPRLLPPREFIKVPRSRSPQHRGRLPSSGDLRELPSYPPDGIRALRKEGLLVNDFSSRLRIGLPSTLVERVCDEASVRTPVPISLVRLQSGSPS